MSYWDIILRGVLLGLFVAISVGPTLFAVIRYSLHHTYRAGIAFVLGVSISDCLYVFISLMATEWLAFLKDHQKDIGMAGAILFIIMGLFQFLKKYKPKRPKRNGNIDISNSTYLKIAGSGFLLNTLNPAVVILWMGASITVSEYGLAQKFIFFGVCLGIVLGLDFCKVFLAEKIRNWLTLRKIMYLNKISALCIFGFGIILMIRVFFFMNN